MTNPSAILPVNPLADIANVLLERGIPMLPLIPGTKRPGYYADGQWRERAGWVEEGKLKPTESNVNLWSSWPSANIGIPLGEFSNIVAVDFDNRPDIYRYIEDRIPQSPVRKKGEKGYTAFYRYNGETTMRGKVGGETIVEILSTGTQTVLPPSIHPNGKAYEWLTPDTLLNFDVMDLPQLPLGFPNLIKELFQSFEKIQKNPKKSSVVNPEQVRAALKFISADDYDTWLRMGMAIYSAMPSETGRELWREWSMTSSKYDAHEFDKKWDLGVSSVRNISIASVFYEASQNGYVHPLSPPTAPAVEARVVSEPLSGGKPQTKEGAAALSLDILNNAPGLVGRMAGWLNETARYPHPALALAASLAAVGSLKSHRVRTESNFRTNLLIIGIAESGAGKNHAIESLIELFTAADLKPLFGGKPESDSAILTMLSAHFGRRFIPWDEIGVALAEMTSPKAGQHKAAILGMMMELFSRAGTTYFGKEYANHDGKMSRKEINQPCLTVYGASTPGRFYQSLSSAHAVDGFLARWLVFETHDNYPKRRRITSAEIPHELIRDCQEIAALPTNAYPRGNVDMAIRPKIIPYSEKAQGMLEDALDYFDNKRAVCSEHEGVKSIWSRAGEHAQKLALTVEESLDEISVESLKWALQLVNERTEKLCSILGTKIADSDYQVKLNRILDILARSGEHGLKSGDLARKTQFLNRRERTDILDALMEAEQVEAVTYTTATKGGVFYRVKQTTLTL